MGKRALAKQSRSRRDPDESDEPSEEEEQPPVNIKVAILFILSVIFCRLFFNEDMDRRLFLCDGNLWYCLTEPNPRELDYQDFKNQGLIKDSAMTPRAPQQPPPGTLAPNGPEQQFAQLYTEAVKLREAGNLPGFVDAGMRAVNAPFPKEASQEGISARGRLLFDLASHFQGPGADKGLARRLLAHLLEGPRLGPEVDQAARYNLGLMLTEDGHMHEAIRVLEEALAVDDSTELAKYAAHQLGTAHRAVGRADRAVEFFELAIALDADAVPPQTELVQTLKLLGRRGEAAAAEARLCRLEGGAHCPRGKAPLLVVGERNSGTNWVMNLLVLNYPGKLWPLHHEVDGTPWKHSEFTSKELAEWEGKAETLVVAVVKDPWAWFASMRRRPWHALPERAEAVKAAALPKAALLPWEERRTTETGRARDARFPSMAALREAKLRGLRHLEAALPRGRFLFCRYEDLLNPIDAQRILGEFMENNGISFDKPYWESIAFPIHGNSQNGISDGSEQTQQNLQDTAAKRIEYYKLRKYMGPLVQAAEEDEDFKDDICEILDQLNPDLERWAGFDLDPDIELFDC